MEVIPQTTHISNNQGTGHRVAGSVSLLWYKFMVDKYFRSLGYIDGIMRYLAITTGKNPFVQPLTLYLTEFDNRVKNNLSVDDLHPLKYQDGALKDIFVAINNKNKTKESRDSPFNTFVMMQNPKIADRYDKIKKKCYNLERLIVLFNQIYKDYKKDIRVYDDTITTTCSEKKQDKRKGEVYSDSGELIERINNGRFTKLVIKNKSAITQALLKDAREKN